jgi:hypothetical protein
VGDEHGAVVDREEGHDEFRRAIGAIDIAGHAAHLHELSMGRGGPFCQRALAVAELGAEGTGDGADEQAHAVENAGQERDEDAEDDHGEAAFDLIMHGELIDADDGDEEAGRKAEIAGEDGDEKVELGAADGFTTRGGLGQKTHRAEKRGEEDGIDIQHQCNLINCLVQPISDFHHLTLLQHQTSCCVRHRKYLGRG